MNRDDLADLTAFAAVAELGSFTKAAATIGMSQSALSRAVRDLERRHRVVLLARTTRHVSLTDAGEALLTTVRPALDTIREQLVALEHWCDEPAGRLRLTMCRMAATTVLWPVLRSFSAENPGVEIEIAAHDDHIDLVSGRFDAGIRLGRHVERDMIAVPVGGELRPTVVAAPHYLARHPAPSTPSQLADHRCIAFRPPAGGPVERWRFRGDGGTWDMEVGGGPVLDDGFLIEQAAVDGLGVAYLFEDQVAEHLREGRLVSLLEAWCPPVDGYHLFYSDRRLVRPALRSLIDALTRTARSRRLSSCP